MLYFTKKVLLLSLLPAASVFYALDACSADIGAHEIITAFYKNGPETSHSPKEKEKESGRYYLMTGMERINEGRYDDALELFEEGEPYITDKMTLYYCRGLAYYLLRRYFEAEAELMKVAYKNGGNAEALRLLGKVYYDRSELVLAVSVWEEARLLLPDDENLEEILSKAKRESRIESGMEKNYTGRFLIRFDGKKNDRIGKLVADILEEAYTDVGADLGHYPEGDIPAIIYTEKEFRDVTGSPKWAGGLYDGKIRVPAGGIEGLTEGLKGLLYHEYTHAVLYSLTRGDIPKWLNEGMALYEERKNVAGRAHNMQKSQIRKAPAAVDEIEGWFASDDIGKIRLAYETSYAFISFLIDNYGLYRLSEMFGRISGGESLDNAFLHAYGDFSLDKEKLFALWIKNRNNND